MKIIIDSGSMNPHVIEINGDKYDDILALINDAEGVEEISFEEGDFEAGDIQLDNGLWIGTILSIES